MNISKRILKGLLLLAFLLAGFSSVYAVSTITFQQGVSGYLGTSDLSISDQYSSSNSGKGQTTITGAYTQVRNATTGNYKYEGIIKFDNLTLPQGARVTDATLTLKLSSWNPGTIIKGYYLNTAWDGSYSDFGWTKKDGLSLWTIPGARGEGQDTIAGKNFVISGITGTGAQTVTISLDKDVVNGWIANPSTNYGLLMYVDPSIANASVSIYSLESSVAGDRPKLSITYDTGSSDTVSPVISSFFANNISTSSANISWATNEASDSLVEYGTTNNYGSFSLIDSNLGITHNIGLTGLLPSTTYHFRVKSKDLSGNLAMSSDVTFTTNDSVVVDPTPLPIINTFSASPLTVTLGASSGLFWDQTGATFLSIDQGIGAVNGTSFSVTPSATTTYTLTATNSKGSASKSVTVGVIVPAGSDNIAPSVPKHILIYKKTTFEAVISWDPSTDNTAVAKYNIYRFGVKIASTTVPTFTDGALESGIGYAYSISAVDAYGNESAQSDPVYIVMPLTSSPTRGDGVCQPSANLSATAIQNVNAVKQILPGLLSDADNYDNLIAPYRNSTQQAVKDAVNMVDLSIKLLRTIPLAVQCSPQDFGYTILPSRLQSIQQALPYFYAKAQAGVDPYAGMKKGTIAIKSNIDNNIDYYYFALPTNYNPTTKYRLRVVLHFAGSCMWEAAGIGTFAPLSGDLIVGQPSANSPLSSNIGDSVYIVPCGRGASHSYAGMAQKNLMDEINDAINRFSIDQNLITISGSSMGGTGSVNLSTHYPDLFSSIGILTGSPDFNLPTGDYRYDGSMLYKNVGSINYVLWDTPGDTSSYQKEENFANNLQTLGTQYPGYYPYRKYTDPAGSHGIINQSLISQGDVFLNQGIRNKYPARVSYVMGSEQYDGAYWIHNMTRPNVQLPGSIEAEISSDKTTITIKTSNLKSFSLNLLPENTLVSGLSNISVSIDGNTIVVPVGKVVFFNNVSGVWSSSDNALSGLYKKKGMSGPIVDVFMDKPVLMVYGTKLGNTAMRGKAMVDALTQVYFGSSVAGDSYMHYGNFEIKADTDVTQDDIQNKNLVLFGTPSQNSFVAQVSSQIPMQFLSNGVTVGGKSYTGTKIGWSVVYPNPLNQSNYVLMVSEDYNMGLIGFINAPVLQNDYVVSQGYDTGLYRRKVLGKGLFDYQWK